MLSERIEIDPLWLIPSLALGHKGFYDHIIIHNYI
jgi:hypothetical protein